MPLPKRSCREPSSEGVYILLLQGEECTLSIGALGERIFSPGWYEYVGSAHGPGGFARVRRHQHLSLHRDRPPRWHIDYLLLDPHFRLRYAIHGFTKQDLECRLADHIGGSFVPDFGCSDCHCASHLFYRTENPLDEIKDTMEILGITMVIKTIKSHG